MEANTFTIPLCCFENLVHARCGAELAIKYSMGLKTLFRFSLYLNLVSYTYLGSFSLSRCI